MLQRKLKDGLGGIACFIRGLNDKFALISSYASWYAEDYLQRELSLPKLINWLKRKGHFANAMHFGTFKALFRNLRRALPKLLCKQKRKRRTSRQLIEEYGHYMKDALAA